MIGHIVKNVLKALWCQISKSNETWIKSYTQVHCVCVWLCSRALCLSFFLLRNIYMYLYKKKKKIAYRNGLRYVLYIYKYMPKCCYVHGDYFDSLLVYMSSVSYSIDETNINEMLISLLYVVLWKRVSFIYIEPCIDYILEAKCFCFFFFVQKRTTRFCEK